MKRPDTVLVTGVAGDLGVQLVPLLRASGHLVVGVDLKPAPAEMELIGFHQLDLGREPSCDELIEIIHDMGVRSVIHLAFVLDPRKSGVLDRERMYHINVGGTARVIEAVTEANRDDSHVRQFIHMSSVAAYGPRLPLYAPETHPLDGGGLLYAEHKREADLAVQRRAGSFGSRCSTVILRPQIFAGPSVHNYMIDALRGEPSQTGKLGRKLRARGKRLPVLVGLGAQGRQRRFQFAHVDDVARLIAFLAGHPGPEGEIELFNVAARGEALSVDECCRITGTRSLRLPDESLIRLALEIAWKQGASDMPPDALPYVLGEYTLSTQWLQERLGTDYGSVIQFTNEQALRSAMGEVAKSGSGASIKTGNAEGVGRP